ncbi:MAG TPA: ABC transporter ATP-binding protein [Bacteroidales bacterium]|nr:ABC transporter ATP-binding protein [Bacteroidales bacterium]
MSDINETIRLESLQIGYYSGIKKNVLLAPLYATGCKKELISVVGRNGIGKSTLLRTAAGIQKAISGNVLLNSKEIGKFSRNELARLAGFISTEQVKVSNMTVFDLVALGRFPFTNWIGSLHPDDEEAIHSAMEKTSVLQFSGKYISELSDGERQRAMIARLLAQDTDIMFLDEPTAFLDIRSKFEVIHILHELAHSCCKTIILSTHDLDLALRHSDKIWLLLDDGIREGSPEDLVIGHEFEKLFDSEIIKFDSINGIFSFSDVPKASIHIKGDFVLRKWTERALMRAGFSVSETELSDYIEITGSKSWILFYKGNKRIYGSIYQLLQGISGLI